MKINLICEVNATLHALWIDTDDELSLPPAALKSRKAASMPKLSGLDSPHHSQEVNNKKLICIFDEEDAALEIANELDAAFPKPAFDVLWGNWEDGLRYGERVTDEEGVTTVPSPVYTTALADIFKYALPVDEVSTPYIDVFNAMSAEEQTKVDPFWSTTDFKKRKFV